MVTTFTRSLIAAFSLPVGPSQRIGAGDVVTAQMELVARLNAVSTSVDATLLCHLCTYPIHRGLKPASICTTDIL
ncbi:hypothetical protein TNCV_3468641 [Trichonephila clavipes]|nr:hypothetical protein TNCV_3468641 [Trichonephila clavipes]